MKERGAVLIEAVVVLPILGFIAVAVFLISVGFVRYIQLSSATHEIIRQANTPPFRGLQFVPDDTTNQLDEPRFRDLVANFRGLLQAYTQLSTNQTRAPFYLANADQIINRDNFFIQRLSRVGIWEQGSEIRVRFRVPANQLLGIDLFPLPQITIETSGPYIFNQDLTR